MDFRLIEKNGTSAKIGLSCTDMTIITPLMEEAEKDKDVKLIRYIESHPELETPVLYIEMHDGDPMKALEKAALSLSVKFSKS